MVKILDQGYIDRIDSWGSEEGIIVAARMSTGGGFKGWGPRCSECGTSTDGLDDDHGCSQAAVSRPGDEKLLGYLWTHQHATPFEMCGMTFEVKAPIFVIREWQRHRTQSYSEASARYAPLPDESYMPTLDRVRAVGGVSKQSQGTRLPSEDEARDFLDDLSVIYDATQKAYDAALLRGVPRELARLVLPVGRYTKMRATANLRNWLAFCTLRCASDAQWEIRQYADAVVDVLAEKFPRTIDLWREDMKKTGQQ